MIASVIFILLCIMSFLFAVHVTTLPFFLGFVLVLFITYRSRAIFLLAFVVGLLFDIMTLHPIGLTSLMLLIVLFLASLYQRKFELRTYPFVFFASFFGTYAISFCCIANRSFSSKVSFRRSMPSVVIG